MNRSGQGMLAFIFLLCGSAAAAQSTPWLHINVESTGAQSEQVKVNVPLRLVETVAPMLEEQKLAKAKAKLQKVPLTVPQMREIWETLKNEGDFELASVQDGDMHLKVVMEGDYLCVRSTEEAEEEISITVPGSVIDALLSGEEDELNLVAAAKALAQTGEGELVSIKDGDDTVRVWVDSSNTSSQ